MFFLLTVLACGGAPSETGDSSDGTIECGASEYYDVSVKAVVQHQTGAPLAGAEVRLEERDSPRTFGSGTTGADGVVEFTASQVESVPNCWGLVLDYWIVAAVDGADVAEDDMNTELYNAISDGSYEADVTGFPLVVTP